MPERFAVPAIMSIASAPVSDIAVPRSFGYSVQAHRPSICICTYLQVRAYAYNSQASSGGSANSGGSDGQGTGRRRRLISARQPLQRDGVAQGDAPCFAIL